MSPIEVTTRYTTTVDDLPSAWAFVMERVDQVGPNPSIKIRPIWIHNLHDMDRVDAPPAVRQFEITVEGMVHEEGEAE